MNNQVNQKFVEEILFMLLTTPSPTSYCQNIMEKVEKEVVRLGFSFKTTHKGCGLIEVPGEDEEQSEDYVIGISAHVDTLGAMVRSIKDSGYLSLTLLGGYMLGSIENEYCTIHTRDGRVYEGTILTTQPSVHVFPGARELKREESTMEIRLDEPVFSKQQVENLGISVGDIISFDPRVKLKDNGYIKSRHLDDKAGVAAIFGLLELLHRERIKPKHTLNIFISNYEEVGHGSSYIPAKIHELIAVDMGAVGDDLSATEQDVSICAKDSTGPYDYRMTSKLIELAKREHIRYAVDIFPHYGSDASAALRGGNDIRAALIGPAVHASHSMERTHIEAILGTSKLLLAYVMEPKSYIKMINE